MAKDIVTTVNEIGMKEGMLDWIQFQNTHHELALSNLFADKVGHNNDDSYTSEDNWNKKDSSKQDIKLVANTNIDEDELEDINDLDDEAELHLNDRIADNKDTTDNKIITAILILLNMKINTQFWS